jgi:predicted metal-dependent phosphoesterase TrpH
MTLELMQTKRWLERALAPARERVKRVPTPEAVERIRRRTFGEVARRTRIAA